METQHEIWVQMGKWFLRKLFKYIDGTPIWETMAERSKVNLNLWILFIAIVTLA